MRAAAALLFAALPCAAWLGGCIVEDPRAHAQQIADSAGLTHESVPAGGFMLTSFVRIGAPDAPLDIYIEGDGRAWRSIDVPSQDPTPRRAMALQLAAQDAAANVVYLARPCQFTLRDPHCETAFWTGKRYSQEIVAAMSGAISRYAGRAPGQALNFIGYSGGGAIAVLIASQRDDVASIRTVAGDLDSEEVMRLHHVSPLPQSLNPIDVARSVDDIAQIHFSGGSDRVVPPAIAQRFAEAVGGPCVQTQVVPGMTHEGAWAAIWPALLAQRVDCAPNEAATRATPMPGVL
jgi:hypothetical protein